MLRGSYYRWFIVCVILFPGCFVSGQVVNTEKLRLNAKESDFVGDADLNLGLTRNKAGQTISLGAQVRLEYLLRRSRWMVLGGYNFTQFNDVDEPGSAPKNFANNSFGHLRYNRPLNEWLTLEAFTQGQWDEIQEIQIRFLTGAGPRFQLISTDSSRLYFGLLYMYEYEETSEFADRLIYNKDHRLSSYLSGGFHPLSYLTVNHVTYFQPNLREWSDFRISSETTLSIRLNTNLALNSYFQIVYDAAPPETVPETMYLLRNGLSLDF